MESSPIKAWVRTMVVSLLGVTIFSIGKNLDPEFMTLRVLIPIICLLFLVQVVGPLRNHLMKCDLEKFKNEDFSSEEKMVDFIEKWYPYKRGVTSFIVTSFCLFFIGLCSLWNGFQFEDWLIPILVKFDLFVLGSYFGTIFLESFNFMALFRGE